jgi:hypothetical protein
MKSSSTQQKIIGLIAAAFMAAGTAIIAAPSASAGQADLVWYFDRTFREVIDVGAEGPSHGEITVTNGNVSEVRGGKSVGTYTTSQITARILIPGGREDRKTDIAISVNGGVIYTTAIVAAKGGTPPTKTSAHAIIGGTGKYSGASGEVILKPLNASRYKVSFFFID